MTDSDFKVQWSVSLPPCAQYAKGHMLNIRGENAAEVEDIFDEILNGSSDFIQKATDVAALLVGAQTVSDTFKSDGPKSEPRSESSSSSESSEDSGSIRTCEHGKRVYKSGNKNGKDWAGYFCPEKNRNNQCDVVWA